MQHRANGRRRGRRHHSHCQATGKIRYRDGDDAGLALRGLSHARSRADLQGAIHRIRVVRKYACPACGGLAPDQLAGVPDRVRRLRGDGTVTFEEMFRSHVERCLQDVWDRPDLVTDPDGDYPFRAVTSMCWVRVERDPSAVRVFAYAATGVKRSAKLLAELNDLNRSARWVTLHWYDGLVVVERALATTEVDRDSVRFALESVVSVADEIGPMIATVHGGATPLEFMPDNEDAA